jgi:hypothetical protein
MNHKNILSIFKVLLIINQIKMKKITLTIFLFSVFTIATAQDWSKAYRQVEEITLNEGLEEDYIKFESFWKTIKEKHVKEGKLAGWFVWKVDPTSNDNKAWADYLIVNVYANEKQMKDMASKPLEWWQNEMKVAHKGKTKRSIIKKYSQETMDNKYRKKSISYVNKGLDAFMLEEASPNIGTKANYIGIEQLNDDYVDFETKFFAPSHKESKARLYWELNEIIDRSENAYKPVTHMIFEIPNPNAPETEWEPSFAEEMAMKYGIASRKFHGTLSTELVNYAW